MPGRGQQRLGLGDVLRALRDAGVGGREHRRERTVVAHVREALEEGLHDLRAVQGQCDRLPHPRVGERRHVVAHRQLTVRAGLELDDVVAAGQQLLAAGDRELADDVDRAADQRADGWGLGGVEGEVRARRLGLRPPVVRVGGERRPLIGGVALQHERPGADERALPLRRVVALGQDDHVVVVGRGQVREITVRRREVELHRVLAGLLDPVRRQHAAERRQCVRRALGVGLQLVGVDDVVGRERLPVVELDALPDLERPDVRGGVGLPAGRELGLQGEGLVGEGEVLAGLAEHVEAALIGHGHRVDRGGRGDDADVDGRARLARAGPAGAAGGTRAGRAAGGQDAAEHGRGDADKGAAAQQLATGETAGHELVDDVIGYLVLPGPQVAERIVLFGHGVLLGTSCRQRVRRRRE